MAGRLWMDQALAVAQWGRAQWAQRSRHHGAVAGEHLPGNLRFSGWDMVEGPTSGEIWEFYQRWGGGFGLKPKKNAGRTKDRMMVRGVWICFGGRAKFKVPMIWGKYMEKLDWHLGKINHKNSRWWLADVFCESVALCGSSAQASRIVGIQTNLPLVRWHPPTKFARNIIRYDGGKCCQNWPNNHGENTVHSVLLYGVNERTYGPLGQLWEHPSGRRKPEWSCRWAWWQSVDILWFLRGKIGDLYDDSF